MVLLAGDPLIKDHDVKYRPLSRLTWLYRKSLLVPDLTKSRRFLLIFEGIDTVAYIIVNDVHVFKSHDNQFRRNVISLSNEQIDGNALKVEVVISSAVVEAEKRAQVST